MLKTQTDVLLPKNKINIHDFILIIILSLALVYMLKGLFDMFSSFHLGENYVISLDLKKLAYYSLRSTMRLLIGMFFSFVFAISFGYLAAKSKHFERIILPFVNFMESVPLVGFLSFTTLFFMTLFPHSIMGLECAAIFGVFTGQAWNMCLVMYQTIRIVPPELAELGNLFRLNAWQYFWKIEFPYSIPGLLWNTMVSQSAAWFALVATEAIPVKQDTVTLPGVGSYIQESLTQGNFSAVIFSIIAIIINIVIFDQILFRPLVKWSSKFKYEEICTENKNTSWFYNCCSKSYIFQAFSKIYKKFVHLFIFTLPKKLGRLLIRKRIILKTFRFLNRTSPFNKKLFVWIWYTTIFIFIFYFGRELWLYIPKNELNKLPMLMLLTALRVAVAMVASILIFVPLGVWIGRNENLLRIFQPIIQILAALPPNILYPLVAIALIFTHQSLSLWSIPLIMLGTQWYILFNVIAGVSSLPSHMIELSNSFGVHGWMWWRKFIIPAIFPYIVTGIISAAGGAWNAAITAEVIQWGQDTISTNGIGAYISNTTSANQMPQAALGCTAMCFMVALCIVFVWKPLYKLAENKYKIS